MTLYFIGLGLYDEKDITVRGLEIIRNSKQVFLEAYTSILMVDVERLEKFYGRKVQVADREMVESFSDKILDASRSSDGDVCFLVVGDPFAATTHSDLYLRARAMGIPTQIIHNASILNAVGSCGLSLYKYGQTVSLVFFTETWQPDSFYDRIKQNRAMGLHTLVLLDIKVKEQSIENLVKNRKIYEPPRYMSVPRAASQLLAIEEKRQENVYNENTVAVAVARAGAMESQAIIVAKLADFAKAEPFEKHENEDEDEDEDEFEFDDDTNENVKIDNLKIDNHHQQMHMLKSLGGPLHSLIIPSKDVHEMELEMLKLFILSPEYESGILASINKH